MVIQNEFPLFLSYSAGYPLTFEEFVEIAHTNGFSGVEFIPDLTPNLPDQLSEDRLNTLRRLKREHQLRYTIHNFFLDINPTSLVPKVRNLAFELTRDVLILASQIEAEAVIIHPGYRFTPWRNKPEQAKLFEEIQKTTYSELANESHKIGVPIFIENGNYYLSARNGERQPLHIGITPDELLQIAHIPSKSPFGICFDVGKAYFSSNNYSANEVVSYIERIAPLLSEVHLNTFSDYQNIIPLVLSSLEAINYSGPIVFECPKDNIKLLYKFFDRHNQA